MRNKERKLWSQQSKNIKVYYHCVFTGTGWLVGEAESDSWPMGVAGGQRQARGGSV